jgi:CheY-like chemotaxis protein
MQKQPGLHVLVVGDKRSLAATLVQSVQADGHEVATVPDGPSALEAAQAALPDVVFLDTPLPGPEGYAVATKIKGLSAWKRPMLVAFAEPDKSESSLRFQDGIDLLLVEPVSPDKLQDFLRRFQRIVQDMADFDPVI